MGYFDNYEKMRELYKLLVASDQSPYNPNVNLTNIQQLGGNMAYDFGQRAIDDYNGALEAGDIGYNEYDSDMDDINNMQSNLWARGFHSPSDIVNYAPENFIGTKMSVVPKNSGFIKPILDSASDAYKIPLEHMESMYNIPMIKNYSTEPYDDYNDLIVESNLPHANTALARWFRNRGK